MSEITEDQLIEAVRAAAPSDEDSQVLLPDGTAVPFHRIIAQTNGAALLWLYPEAKEAS